MIKIEDRIFQRCSLNLQKLISFGFCKEVNDYVYSTTILDNTFNIEIKVNETSQKIEAKVLDVELNEEYINYRVESQTGNFVKKILDELEALLIKIKEECTVPQEFIGNQANRICDYIKNQYGDTPEYLWKKYHHGVFRNPLNEKWYVIIMNINKSKII